MFPSWWNQPTNSQGKSISIDDVESDITCNIFLHALLKRTNLTINPKICYCIITLVLVTVLSLVKRTPEELNHMISCEHLHDPHEAVIHSNFYA